MRNLGDGLISTILSVSGVGEWGGGGADRVLPSRKPELGFMEPPASALEAHPTFWVVVVWAQGGGCKAGSDMRLYHVDDG